MAVALPLLSKSKYTAGVQCLKRLWLQVNEPALAPETDAATQARFDQGTEVGEAARKAFPGGVLIEDGYKDHASAVRRTQSLLADRAVPAIFEAAFTYENIRVHVDVLERLRGGRLRLIEVKSTTQVKPEHLPDVAIQQYVLSGCGVKLAGSYLMHLDRTYVYPGGEYDYDQLFNIADIDDDLEEAEAQVPEQLRAERAALRRDTAPDIEPGGHCTQPYECEFFQYCNPEMPPDHVSCLPRLGRKKLDELLALGCERLRDIPDDFPLTETQQRACQCAKARRPWFGPGLTAHLKELRYPLWFLDFETIGLALPRWPGTRPYDGVPFQFSIHVQRRPGEAPVHHEFLADGSDDPRQVVLDALLTVLAQHRRPAAGRDNRNGVGSVIVYNKSMEAGVLRNLAARFPGKGKLLEPLLDNLWDLLAAIRAHVYHPKFYGSFSLKSVAPALTNHRYAGLAVADGVEAGVAFMRLLRSDVSAIEARRLRRDLLAYCGQDTACCLDIVEVLQAQQTGNS